MIRHSLMLKAIVPPPRPARPAWPLPNNVASTSRYPLSSLTRPPSPPQYRYTVVLKGKAKGAMPWDNRGRYAGVLNPTTTILSKFGSRRPTSNQIHATLSLHDIPRLSPSMGGIRSFHATPRRQALPLVPALGALLKGTSLLTLTTGISRLLLSFFPIGTLAMFRFRRGVSWLSKDKRIPKASPEAEEFWKMWCQGEKGVILSMADALSLVEAPETANGDLISPDGRIAYPIPMRDTTRQRWVSKQPEKPEDVEDGSIAHAKWVKVMANRIRHAYFFLPPLPPVSVRFYNELSTAQQHQVDALRQYWVSLRMFKDKLRTMRWIVTLLFFMPVLLLLGVWATALEHVPVTGRWRLILLTADEEDVVASSLEGGNWYKSVINLLTTEEKPAPPIVPLNDWRWQWVQNTLRRLESGVLMAVERAESGGNGRLDDPTTRDGHDSTGELYPPPSKYPLRPRARASARLHAALPSSAKDASGAPKTDLGPPYNILLMEAPDRNAFSYGFGGKGAGGIVVFTGLLDEILAHNGPPPLPPPEPKPRGWMESIFSANPRPVAPTHPEPTEAQTLHLAMVLAHEMGHLLLSHHLETLSHQQVLWPSVLGLQIDIIRAILWPFTILFGPAVNDALASLGRTTAEEMTEKFGHVGFERKHEYEADLTGLRILSHASFDPRGAVENFAGSVASLEEMGRDEHSILDMIKLWSWSGHPSPAERAEAMHTELKRWEKYDEEERTQARPE